MLFLYNKKTDNPRHHLFHILVSTLLKTFFSPLHKCPTYPGLLFKNIISRKQTLKLSRSDHKKIMITRILIKLNFIRLQFTERQ